VKAVLAILFSVILIGTPFLSAAAAPCAKPMPRACCHGGVKMDCCDTKSDSQPSPIVPAQNPSLNLALFITTTVLWAAPEAPMTMISSAPALRSGDAPLYTRHCALLL